MAMTPIKKRPARGFFDDPTPEPVTQKQLSAALTTKPQNFIDKVLGRKQELTENAKFIMNAIEQLKDENLTMAQIQRLHNVIRLRLRKAPQVREELGIVEVEDGQRAAFNRLAESDPAKRGYRW